MAFPRQKPISISAFSRIAPFKLRLLNSVKIPGRAITRGAMTAFIKTPEGYDFDTNYNALEAVYRGLHKFHPRIKPLNNPSYPGPSCPIQTREF